MRRQRRAVGRDGILVDVGGRSVRLLRAELVLLRDAGLRQAGKSSTARDLALLLDRALESPSPLVLHGAEVRALTRLAGDAQLLELPSRLAAPTRGATRDPGYVAQEEQGGRVPRTARAPHSRETS